MHAKAAKLHCRRKPRRERRVDEIDGPRLAGGDCGICKVLHKLEINIYGKACKAARQYYNAMKTAGSEYERSDAKRNSGGA